MAADAGAAPPAGAIRFDDGAAYERFMGVWSRLAGERFLDWLAPRPGGRWLDVGCGNGAFTELLLERAAPAWIEGIDPAPAQIAHAAERLAGRPARVAVGDAGELPFESGVFDAAVMALVVFFVPDPARAVGEMARVVAPGGSVGAYAWDLAGGGFPYAALQEEMAAIGIEPMLPPSPEASRLDRLVALWTGAGMTDVATDVIEVERTFASFDAFWETARAGPRLAPKMAGLAEADRARLQATLRARLAADADGRVAVTARANAVRGTVARVASETVSRRSDR